MGEFFTKEANLPSLPSTDKHDLNPFDRATQVANCLDNNLREIISIFEENEQIISQQKMKLKKNTYIPDLAEDQMNIMNIKEVKELAKLMEIQVDLLKLIADKLQELYKFVDNVCVCIVF